MILIYSVVLLSYLIFSASAVFAKRTSVAIYLSGIVSTSTFFLYYLYNAADVALTEISVGVLLTFLFFYLVYLKTLSATVNSINLWVVLLVFLCCVGVFSIIIYVGFLLEEISLLHNYSKYYNTNLYSETHIANTVTGVLASYRAFDTFGETLIIATSSFGVLTILKHHK